MKAKEYEVLRMAVEQGVRIGYAHAHKHVDHPTADAIMDGIVEDVMTSVCEWFAFPEPEGEA
jgi:chromosome condensin MukBEF complex kleisin-like MukF subunit